MGLRFGRACLSPLSALCPSSRRDFAGGPSAQNKGHRGHQQRLFCCPGFQIKPRREQGV
ncbi:hypothetical protein SKAU_G00088310 [Synaphobranchus kaupii]|uniref:Uncharacterized protein n=1 Tax=Synaphobranchus kaupii TaxID=118154 RepID=A0A9Q1FX01_SYNKA|nr:hypothetical protein SKAU_G00088310 [Synaphobranchus kaupii]